MIECNCGKFFQKKIYKDGRGVHKKKYCYYSCGIRYTKKGKKWEKWIKINIGEKHHNWKGNKAGYDAIHDWVKRWHKKANKCCNCHKRWKRRYEWANISGKYRS